jgi:hypothetical protein
MFGILSLIFISATFVSGVPGEELLLLTVASCLVISILYLSAYLRGLILVTTKANHQLEFLFHAVAAFLLLMTGIDWVAWDNYAEICQDQCPPAYLVAVAKIIAFINGTLYGVVAFMNTRTWKSINPEEHNQLLNQNSTTPSRENP